MPATSRIEAPLVEVFSSVQGEGLLIGCRQVFVRFAQCNLACAYCDTPFETQPEYRLESPPGSGRFSRRSNPADLAELTIELQAWQAEYPGLHHSLVLTGGEPLLQVEALQRWLPEVTTLYPIFLETNGTLPDALTLLLPMIRWISMDIKSEEATGQPTPWDQHAAFIRTAGDRLCQVKLVVDAATTDALLNRAAGLIHDLSPGVELILQPRTAQGVPAVAGMELLRMQAQASKSHSRIRVIPQVHPLLRIS